MSVSEEPVASCACAAGTTSKRRFAWDLGELVVGYALILGVIWTPRPLQRWLWAVALGWFLISMVLSFEGWKTLGCCVAGFWRSSWVVGLAVVLAGIGTYFASWFHTLHPPVIQCNGSGHSADTPSGRWCSSYCCRATFWHVRCG